MPNSKTIEKQEQLRIEIEQLRSKMIKVGMRQGLTSSETVRISQKLDLLLNRFQSY